MPAKRYKPKGEFKDVTEAERQRVFVRAVSDTFIENEVNNISDYLIDFGTVSAKELILMLSTWLCDPKNKKESEKYWRILSGKN